MKRIGIYSGTFDPVHAGHVSFALQALSQADLDVIYFLPERRPRGKDGIEHFGHRVAMLKRASRPHRKLRVLELEDVSFSVATTLPRLQKRFPKARLVFLLGSDIAMRLPEWTNSEQFLKTTELVVGIRSADKQVLIQESINRWTTQPLQVLVFESHAPAISSRKIREALRKREYVPGLLRSVEKYSNRNWLYVSLG